jgi:cytochrome c oxidase assembly protein subunit 15
MRTYRRLALSATIITYLLIFIGGLVRVSGAGMGCPDWPTCFGRWIPPTSLDQLPPGIDSATFNLTLAWIEYFNRLFGVLTGLVILATAGVALKVHRRHPKILWPSVSALGLVMFEGWLGSAVVATVLDPFMITLHMLLALVIVSLLIYALAHSYYLEYPDQGKGYSYPSVMKNLVIGLWIIVMVEVLIGTDLRAGLELIREESPLLEKANWLRMLSPIKYLHTILGVVLAGISIYLARLLSGGRTSPLIRNILYTIIGLLILQIILGEGMVFFQIPQLLRLLHMWSASWVIGLVLVLYTTLKQSEVLHEN